MNAINRLHSASKSSSDSLDAVVQKVHSLNSSRAKKTSEISKKYESLDEKLDQSLGGLFDRIRVLSESEAERFSRQTEISGYHILIDLIALIVQKRKIRGGPEKTAFWPEECPLDSKRAAEHRRRVTGATPEALALERRVEAKCGALEKRAF